MMRRTTLQHVGMAVIAAACAASLLLVWRTMAAGVLRAAADDQARPPGGLCVGLGKPDEPAKPDHRDLIDMPRAVAPVPLVPLPVIDAGGPVLSAPLPPDPALDAEIERVRAEIAAVRAADAPATRDPRRALDDARATVSLLRRAADAETDQARAKASAPDADEEADLERLRVREQAFEARFAALRDAIRQGEKPGEMKNTAWASLCDDFDVEEGALAALRQSLAGRAQARAAPPEGGPARVRLDAAEAALVRLNAAVERAVEAPPARDEEALRLHRLHLTTLERRLTELEQIKAERAGEEMGRTNASTAAAYYRETDWFTESLGFISREIGLMGRALPPADALDADPIIADWLKQAGVAKPSDVQRVRVRSIERRIELLSAAAASAEAEVEQADAQQRAAAGASLREEQGRTRTARVEQYRAAVVAVRGALEARLVKERARLEQMVKEEAGAPAAPPG